MYEEPGTTNRPGEEGTISFGTTPDRALFNSLDPLAPGQSSIVTCVTSTNGLTCPISQGVLPRAVFFPFFFPFLFCVSPHETLPHRDALSLQTTPSLTRAPADSQVFLRGRRKTACHFIFTLRRPRTLAKPVFLHHGPTSTTGPWLFCPRLSQSIVRSIDLVDSSRVK